MKGYTVYIGQLILSVSVIFLIYHDERHHMDFMPSLNVYTVYHSDTKFDLLKFRRVYLIIFNNFMYILTLLLY